MCSLQDRLVLFFFGSWKQRYWPFLLQKQHYWMVNKCTRNSSFRMYFKGHTVTNGGIHYTNARYMPLHHLRRHARVLCKNSVLGQCKRPMIRDPLFCLKHSPWGLTYVLFHTAPLMYCISIPLLLPLHSQISKVDASISPSWIN